MLRFTSSFHTYSNLMFGAALFAASACGGDSEGAECLPAPAAACTPEINTEFSSIHRALFAQRCGTSGGACHGPDGRKGGLVLTDADAAYNALLGMDGTRARVVPGDPDCSLLMQLLESDDPAKRMPYGENKLSEGLRCAVRTWIEAGAVR